MRKVLLTGINGFVASHLAEHYLALGSYEVHGTVRWRSNLENVEHIKDSIKLHYCDFRDRQSVDSVIRQKLADFDIIHHLAGQSFVKASFDAPSDTMETNVLGLINLLESVRAWSPNTVVHITGSSEAYGIVHPWDCPLNEDHKLKPVSPYGISKMVQELLGEYYFKSYGIKTVITRAFNHSGSRRSECFAESTFAKQIIEIKLGLTNGAIKVGNLEAMRDYTHVKDMARAYSLAVERCEYGTPYVIASGEAVSMREVLNKLIEMAGIECRIEIDADRIRPSDVPLLIGDYSRFKEKTGWMPNKSLGIDAICQDLLEYWTWKLSNRKAIEYVKG